jgi:two-component system repressor protein LuxO
MATYASLIFAQSCQRRADPPIMGGEDKRIMALQNPILLAETSPALAAEYKDALRGMQRDVRTVSSVSAVLAACRDGQAPALLILDLSLPQPADGLHLLQTLKEERRLPPVIVMTGSASVNTAVRAMQLGARDFLIKPFHPERLISAALSSLNSSAENTNESMPPDLAGETLMQMPMTDNVTPMAAFTAPQPAPAYKGFIGTSPAMLRIYEQIEHAAKSHATVFITGESGTGKEVCAEAVHALSGRRARPFIPINCAAIPRDLMESELFGHVKGAFTGAIADREGAATLAHGGTLFLDEIAEMTPDMQTKLLRFLQDLTFMKVGGGKLERTDVRIVCATNRDPLSEIRAGRFREDLFYRLHVLPIAMPPLRTRGDDIIDLAAGLLHRFANEEGKRFDGFSADAEAALQRYGWPGNIRQLQNVIRHVTVMRDGGMITAHMLPESLLHAGRTINPDQLAAGPQIGADNPVLRSHEIRPLAEVERETIEHAIALYGGNIARAASALGISPSTIYRKKMGWDGCGDDLSSGAADA